MRAEYDFAGGVRGKYYQQYVEGIELLKPEPPKKLLSVLSGMERTEDYAEIMGPPEMPEE